MLTQFSPCGTGFRSSKTSPQTSADQASRCPSSRSRGLLFFSRYASSKDLHRALSQEGHITASKLISFARSRRPYVGSVSRRDRGHRKVHDQRYQRSFPHRERALSLDCLRNAPVLLEISRRSRRVPPRSHPGSGIDDSVRRSTINSLWLDSLYGAKSILSSFAASPAPPNP